MEYQREKSKKEEEQPKNPPEPVEEDEDQEEVDPADYHPDPLGLDKPAQTTWPGIG